MQSPQTSIAEVGALTPIGNNLDRAAAFTELANTLRDAPMTADRNAIFEAAAETLAASPAEPVTPDRVRCLIYISRHHYDCGNAHDGIDPAEQAVALAQQTSDSSLLAKSLNALGVLYTEAGSYPDAVSTLSRALQAAEMANDQNLEVSVLSNLGLAHQYSGHFGAAIPCYERAVARAARSGTAAIARSAALGNLALAYLHLRDFPAGLTAVEEAIAGLQNPSDPHERAIRVMSECYYARLSLEVRNFPQARERLALARGISADASEMSQLTTDMTQGLLEVYDPTSRDIGLSRLQRAVNESRKGSQSALRDALTMMVRGYEAAGQPNSALVYLNEVVQLNRDSRVRNVLTNHRRHLAKLGRNLDLRARAVMDDQHEALRFQRLSMDTLRECMLVLEKNTVAAELHDDETGEHCYRVGALARELALRSGMDGEMCTLIDLSARLHDIGKLRVPDSILLKPGRFTADERTIMEAHCHHGWELIGEGGLAQLFVAQEIALNHHERWDGTGYPNRRSGSMIPLAARVTALADVFDALTHRRCYKDAWSVADALAEIARLRGKHFDPELTDIFLELVPALQRQHGDLDAYLGVEARKNDFIADRARVARELKVDTETFDARR